MKPSIFISLILALGPLQAETPTRSEQPEWKHAFAALSSAKRESFTEHVTRARQLLEQKRIFEALESLRDARAVFPDSPEVETLIGRLPDRIRRV